MKRLFRLFVFMAVPALFLLPLSCATGQSGSGSAEYYAAVGIKCLNTEQYDYAVENFTKALEINPDEKKYYLMRSTAYIYMEKFDKAVSDCVMALYFDRDYRGAYYNRAYAYTRLKEYMLAIRDWSELISSRNTSRFDDHGEAYIINDEGFYFCYEERGWCRLRMGEYQKALDDCTESILLKQDYADSYATRGCAYYELNDYEKAESDLNRALKLNPECVNALAFRGLLYSKMKKYTKALENLEKALDIEPEREDILDIYNQVLKEAKMTNRERKKQLI